MPADAPPPPARVALVTGGARRVGRSVALHLARAGWDVAITYHTSSDDASSLAGAVEMLGRQFQMIRADLSDPDAATARVAEAVSKRYARLDLLLHNASVYEPSGLFDATAEQMRKMFAVHAESPLLLTRRLAPLLKVAGGTVIAMTDVNVDRPRPAYAAYTMSKAALANLVPSLARELAPLVTANAIAPGVVEWPADMPSEQRDEYLERVPLGRAGTGEDVARLVEFLCTGGKYVTGQTIRLDGGRSVR